MCPADRLLESSQKKKTQTSPQKTCYLYSWQFPLPLFLPCPGIRNTLLQRQVRSLRFPAVSSSPSSFPGPVKDWDCHSCLHKWQQAGKTPVGCRKLRAPGLSLGWFHEQPTKHERCSRHRQLESHRCVQWLSCWGSERDTGCYSQQSES